MRNRACCWPSISWAEWTFSADDLERPYIRLGADWIVSAAGAGSAELTLEGLWFGASGAFAIIIRGDWTRVTIRHCTLDPGGRDSDDNPIQAVRLWIEGSVDELVIELAPSGITFQISTNSDQDLTYSGRPEVVDGKLRMTDMEASQGFLDWIFPADDLGEAIEDAVNNYLAENNLQLESLELTDDALTLETVPAA